MAAAPADFRAAAVASAKIKKGSAAPSIALAPTPDILRESVPHMRAGAVRVGFALETDDGVANARQKLESKSLDIIVAQRCARARCGLRRRDESRHDHLARWQRGGSCRSCSSARSPTSFSIACCFTWRHIPVKAEDLLRRYLEQRREMGETELVLDGLSVEEVDEARRHQARRRREPVERARGRSPPRRRDAARGRAPRRRDGARRCARAASRRGPRATEREPSADEPPPHSSCRSAPFAEQVAAERAPPPCRGIPAAPHGLVVGSAEIERVPGEIGAAPDLEQLAELIATLHALRSVQDGHQRRARRGQPARGLHVRRRGAGRAGRRHRAPVLRRRPASY